MLVDCGLVQEWDLEQRNRDPLAIAPAEIEDVLLTHAHLDHSGNLPRLVHQGFRGRIWCTEATRDIAQVLLMDAARLHQEDVAHRKRRLRKDLRKEGRHTHAPPVPPPLYTVGDVRATMPHFTPVPYHQPIPLARGLSATFRDAGHILGAASVAIAADRPEGRVRLLFSGDLGRPGRPILHDPEPAPAADYVIVESTYGDRLHDHGDVEEALAVVVNRTVARGGNIVIPAFAVERAQEVLLHLRRLMEAGRIPPLLTFLDSPMATAVTRLFRRYPRLLDADVAAQFVGRRSPFEFPSLQVIATPEASKAINQVTGSVIIIAGAGMCDGGRVTHHLTHNIGRPESTVLFVGYQAPGTLGRRIVDGASEVRIFGEPYAVRARIEQIRAFSAHADQNDLVRWLQTMSGRPRRVFVVHGEHHVLLAFRERLAALTGWDVAIPAYGETVELSG
jgi:metallo-beta-lactamase family protein